MRDVIAWFSLLGSLLGCGNSEWAADEDASGLGGDGASDPASGSGGHAAGGSAAGGSSGGGGSGPGGGGSSSGGGGAVCGNDVREAGEACDGADLGSATCVSLGYDGGKLTCSSSCTLDDSECHHPVWGIMAVLESWNSSNTQPAYAYNAAMASFSQPGQTMAVETAGDCARYVYTGPLNITYLAAGNVTVLGTSVSPITLVPQPFAQGHYYDAGIDWLQVSDLFAPGATISFSNAGGAGIPAVSGSVVAPSPIQILQPANFDSLTSIPLSALTIAWVPGNATSATVVVMTHAGSISQSITCTVPDSAGSLTIPASLMSDLHANPSMMSLTVSRVASSIVSSAGKGVHLYAASSRSRTNYNP
jgi:hypothetical protein